MKNRIQSFVRLNVVLALFISGAFSCMPQSKETEASIVRGETGAVLDSMLTPFCEGVLADFNLPGLAVGVVHGDDIVYARGFGYLDIESKKQLNASSNFHMASISKPFVATAIMQLVEKEKMNLDSTVLSYLPYFKLEGGEYDRITIRQMLNHISGMPDVDDYEWDQPVYDENALEKYVRSISMEEMIAPPGEEFAYSNMAFECLGDVIAKVSGMPFADYVEENILHPAGMLHSSFLKPEYLPDNWAAPHLRITRLKVWDGYPYNRMHGPSSTLHSNAIDMCNWALMNLNRGAHKGNTVLQSSSYDLLWKPWFSTGNEDYIGLSWFLGSYNGETTVGHGGGDTGFNTNLVLLPDQSMAVVVMCNLNPAPVNRITNAALDILLGREPAHYKKVAIIPVSKALEHKGLDVAVSMWDSLASNHEEEYDFNAQFLSGLITAVDMDQPEDAEMITEFYARVLERENIEGLVSSLKKYAREMPENEALPAAICVFEESLK